MPERVHRVVLQADVSGFKRSMSEAADATKKIGTSADDTSQKGSTAFEKLGGVASKVLGAAAIAGAAKAIFDVGLSYDQSLNSMQAVTSATGDEMARVSELAKQLGSDINIPGASASDAAEAMTELAKGGLSLQESMAAAKGTLQLATAAQISGAEAATIQADALNAFNLEATEAGHVADLLANAANAATGDIGDFGQGLAQSSAVAHGLGISIDDNVTVLGLFANAGIKGSDAGTSFKTMLTQLQNPTEKAAGAMQELGITAFDAQGNFVGMRTITEQLAVAQANMSTQAFSSAAGIVFGSDAIRGATVLASSGVNAYDQMSQSLGKVGGAAQLAAAQAQGLPGALSNIKNQAETVALSLYERVSPALEGVLNTAADVLPAVGEFFGDVVEGAGEFIGFISDLPGPVLAAAAALAAVAVLKDPVSEVFEKLGGGLEGFTAQVQETAEADKLSETLEASGISAESFATALEGGSEKAKELKASSAGTVTGMNKLGAAAKVAGAGLLTAFGGPVGLAITGITAVVSQVGSAMSDLELSTNDFGGAVDELTGKVAAARIIELIPDSQVNALKEAGIELGLYANALAGVPGAADQVEASLGRYLKTQEGSSDAIFVATDLIKQFGSDLNGVGTAQDAFTEKQRAVTDLIAEQNASGLWPTEKADAYGKSLQAIAEARGLDGVNQQVSGLGTAMDAVQRAGAAYGPVQEDVNKAWDDGSVNASELATQVSIVMQKMDEYAGKNGDAEAAQRAFNSAAVDYNKLLLDQSLAGDQLAEAEQKVKDAQTARDEVQANLNKSTEEGGTTQAQLDQANRDVTASTVDLQKVQQDQKLSGDELTETQNNLKSAMLTNVQAAVNNAVATGNVKDAHLVAAQAVQNAKDAFIAMQSPADIASGKAKTLADNLFGIPEDVATTVVANTLTAEDRIAALQGKLDALRQTITVRVQAQYDGVQYGGSVGKAIDNAVAQVGRADGGMFRNGRPVEHAANGLTRIVKGGANLVHWAEPETVWESFISGKPSQRARNHGLMAQTATLLGGTYIPPGAGVQQFANGGLNVGAQRSFMGSSVVNNSRGGNTYNVSVQAPANRAITGDELVRAVREAERTGRL